ncbi:MAG: glycoside hydrolase family 127 protein [Caldilineaceae bacterium]
MSRQVHRRAGAHALQRLPQRHQPGRRRVLRQSPASDGAWFFNYGTAATRSPWFSCSCCPTNVVRLLGSPGSYIYAQRNGDLYVNLFVGGGTTVNLNGVAVGASPPVDPLPVGRQCYRATDPAEADRIHAAGARKPGWALGQAVPAISIATWIARPDVVALLVNGDLLDVEVMDGYAAVTHGNTATAWTLALATPVRRVVSHEAVAENAGRGPGTGPLVYCVEGSTTAGRWRTSAAAGGRHDHARVGR